MGSMEYQEAIERVAAERFDIVVVALRDDIRAARDVLENVAEREGEPVNLVCLGQEEHRSLVRALPSADYLSMPAFVRDVVTTARLRSGRVTGSDRAIVRGLLADFGLLSLVRCFQSTRNSAVVHLERADRRGELRFSKGELTFAQAASQQGVAALHLMLLWEQAAFDAEFKDVARRGQLSEKGRALIEGCERFLRDFTAATEALGQARTIYRPTTRAQQNAAGSDVEPVLHLVDDLNTLGDIVDDSPFQIFDTLRILSLLKSRGLIERSHDRDDKPGITGAHSPVLRGWLEAPGVEGVVKPKSTDSGNRDAKESERRETAELATEADSKPLDSALSDPETTRRSASEPSAIVSQPKTTKTATTAPTTTTAPESAGGDVSRGEIRAKSGAAAENKKDAESAENTEAGAKAPQPAKPVNAGDPENEEADLPGASSGALEPKNAVAGIAVRAVRQEPTIVVSTELEAEQPDPVSEQQSQLTNEPEDKRFDESVGSEGVTHSGVAPRRSTEPLHSNQERATKNENELRSPSSRPAQRASLPLEPDRHDRGGSTVAPEPEKQPRVESFVAPKPETGRPREGIRGQAGELRTPGPALTKTPPPEATTSPALKEPVAAAETSSTPQAEPKKHSIEIDASLLAEIGEAESDSKSEANASGEFDAVEKDFFEREADLYKADREDD